MGSPGPVATDCTVGSIVWVRRRNGSWWPGKILGPEELDVSHLTSPRSGTPVKLLGREDASVDWYNLEKSKRVKAFRCGDFDACIERVESSQGIPIRKREKYARREDAILHALELERELLKKQGKILPEGVRNRNLDSAKEEFVTSTTMDCSGNRSAISNHQLRSNHIENLVSRNIKDEDHPSGEEDHPEVATKMRGLQDFGLRTASSKRKMPCSSGPDGSPVSSGDVSIGRSGDVHWKGQIGCSIRTKRSRHVHSLAETCEAFDCRGSPSNQTEMVHSFGDVDSHQTLSVNEGDASEYMEDGDSDSLLSDSDSSETEDDMDEEIGMLSGIKHPRPTKVDVFLKHQMADDESLSSEENDESSLSGGTPHLYSHDPLYTNETVSKWQHKGKRNMRNVTRKASDRTDARRYNGFVYGTYRDSRHPNVRQKSLIDKRSFHGINHLGDGFDENELYDDFEFGRSSGGLSRSSRSAFRSQNNFRHNMLDWVDTLESYNHNRMRRQQDPRFFGQRRSSENMRPILVDVDLTVQRGYKKEPVPIVSLTSSLDGRAIIGHPIQVETLPDGSPDSFLYRGDISNEASHHDRSLGPTLPWKTTSKRSNSRVPRLHPFSSVQADEAAEDYDEGRKVSFKKLNVGIFSNDGCFVRKGSLPRVPRPPADKKILKKAKKTSSAASQKTRALSSIGMEQSHGLKPFLNSNNIQIDGFSNKQDLSGPPPVACIPVKLVFSRLLEKINRPASKAPIKAGLYSSGARREP